jgi:transcriptional regulator with XRE-family HTH domain
MSTTPLQKLTRDTLDEKGWSIRQASLKAGLSHSTLHKLLHAENPKPTAKTVLSLAELFGWDKVRALELAGLGIKQVRVEDQEENIGTARPIPKGMDTKLEQTVELLIVGLQELNSTLLILGEKLDILVLLLAVLLAPTEASNEPEPKVLTPSKDREPLKAALDKVGAQVAELLNKRYGDSVVETLIKTRHKRGRKDQPDLIRLAHQ